MARVSNSTPLRCPRAPFPAITAHTGPQLHRSRSPRTLTKPRQAFTTSRLLVRNSISTALSSCEGD